MYPFTNDILIPLKKAYLFNNDVIKPPLFY